ncbi:MAG: hypothetical protein ABR903_05520 [Thermodesulfovibrionales bacterium]
MREAKFIALIIVVACCLCFQQAYAGSLQTHQGRYFKWATPAGWRQNETMNGVDLTSPDNKYGSGFSTLLHARGKQTPMGFIKMVFSSVPDYKNPIIISTRNLSSQRIGYQTWQVVEATISYTDKGLPVTGLWQVGIANYYGQYDATVLYYRSANGTGKAGQAFLPQIAKSIEITNTAEFAGSNLLIHPNISSSATASSGHFDGGSPYMKGWENQNKARDESMRKDTNIRRGYEPAYDDAGNVYNPTSSQWNATRGGYVNPKNPTELLHCGTPDNPRPCTNQ